MGRPLISVFAVEDTAVQVVWRTLPGPSASLELGDHVVHVEATPPAYLRRTGRRPIALIRDPGAVGGPGAVTIDGLCPDTTYDLTVVGPGLRRRLIQQVTTLAAPPGRLLCKFATVNDLHLGESRFGVTKTIEDVFPLPDGWEPYTLRCARAALDEAIGWGAETIVVKGDLTRDGAPAEFREAGELLASLPVAVEVTLGNHDFHDLETDGRPTLAESGVNVPREPWARDLPGIRVVLGHTARADSRWGRMDAHQRAQIVKLAAASPSATFVAVHHQPQRWRLPNQYPPGVPGPEAGALLSALAEANPATMVASGHTHRHRTHRHGPLVAVEVGSTKDYPGTWAGYAVHEGGIRQVVRRVAAPSAINWTETTYWALGGVWGRWSPGPLRERCFTHVWPARR
ncbi:MAG TPA: metallophosphoesterase [Acidimicrobiales bacterium]|nr:metallophosphoesterase [Acidimicrobiales bacterium]